ncbi:MAG: AMP-binding protein [Lachnospiraceae bacterium]|nr:AMP-binding protein [Lachnospiraceae bacterium]
MSRFIRDIIEDGIRNNSSKIAVKWLVRKDIYEVTFAELGRDIKKLRYAFEDLGCSRTHMALIGKSSLEWIEAYLAMVTGTQVAVPLDFNLPDDDLTELIQRADIEVLFIDSSRKSLIDKVKNECPMVRNICLLERNHFAGSDSSDIYVCSLGDLLLNAPEDAKDLLCDPEDISTIIYTSGTTGKSKGVMLSQNNLAENILSVKIDDKEDAVLLSVLPIHHAYCLVCDWLKGLSMGATIAINDSLLHMVRNMGIFKPDLMLMVPLMVESIYKRLQMLDPSISKKDAYEKVFGGRLEYIFTGGAHLDPFYIDAFEEYGIKVLEGYGMSESSPVISMNGMHENKKGSIGRPLENAEISFENGEILVRGTSVMKGYYKMPEETAEALRGGWLHTGDKGYLDKDGYLFINGRVKNLIILSNGENISPEEIENKLGLEACIGEIIITGENNGLKAYIYPDQGFAEIKSLNEEQMAEEVQKVIDGYNLHQPSYKKIVSLYIRKTPFIKSSTQKIRREKVAVEQEAASV